MRESRSWLLVAFIVMALIAAIDQMSGEVSRFAAVLWPILAASMAFHLLREIER